MIEKRRIRALCAILLVIGFSSYLIAARIPGTKVSLVPPEQFVPAQQFPGYLMKETNSAIMVMELPGPFKECSKAFDKPANSVLKNGISIISNESFMFNGCDAVLLKVSQVANNTLYYKWMVVFGDTIETVIVSASYPMIYDDKISKILKEAILTAKWDRSLKINSFEGLPFQIEGNDNFQIAKKMGNNIIFSDKGVFPLKSKDDPFVVVGASLSQDWDVNNKKEFASSRLMSTQYVDNIKILKEEDIRVDNIDGVRLLAKGKDTETNVDIFIYHVVLYSQDGYFLFQGFSTLQVKEKYSKIFDEMLNSFKRNK